MVLYMEPLPVIDYERMKRVYPQVTGKGGYNWYTYLCAFFIIVGILVLIKRYRDKQSYTI
jgi:hypothetical protein